MDIASVLFANLDLTLFLVFAVLLGAFLYWEYRRGEKLEIQHLIPFVLYAIMYRTKWGLKRMDSFAKRCSTLIRFSVPVIIFVGIAGMVLFAGMTLYLMIEYLQSPATQMAPLQLVLPFESAVTFYLPFLYWVLGIFFIATIHEFAHGVIARYYKMKVKSTGFAFFGIVLPVIPAAFVEPDEKDMLKRSWKEQTAMYAAGPFINIVSFFALLAVLAVVFSPIADSIVSSEWQEGLVITSIAEDSALTGLGFVENETRILAINDEPLGRQEAFIQLTGILHETRPGDVMTITTQTDTYEITLIETPDDREHGMIGANFAADLTGSLRASPYRVAQGALVASGMRQFYAPPESIPEPLQHVSLWVMGLIFWTAIISLGIGAFNLLPIFIADGGRILLVTLEKIFKLSPERSASVVMAVSWTFVILIVVTLIAGMPFVQGLFV
ncbi:MAG: site-2 protease family protein [Candidatus Woesearchaeota archaeon]